MTFFNKLKRSIYDPEFYSGLVREDDLHPFKYFFKLILTVALVYAIFFSITAIGQVKEFLQETGDSILTNYPNDLEIKFQKGTAVSNVKEPYFIKIPQEINGKAGIQVENMLVINTKSDFVLSEFESYNTLGLLAKDAFVTKDGRGKIQVMPLKGVPDYTINRTVVERWIGKTQSFVKIVPYLIPIISFVGVFLAQMLTLIYAFFAGFIVYLISKSKNLNLSYKKSYHLSLYLVTLPIIVETLMFIFGINRINFLPTIILVVLAWINLEKKVAPTVLVHN